MFMWLLLLLLNVIAFGAASLAHSSESRISKKSRDSPSVSTTVTSSKLTVRNQDNQAVFEEAVVLTRGSLMVSSDKMVVYFHSQNAEAGRATGGASPKDNTPITTTSNRSIDRAEATGHVKIKQDNSNATCQKAVYFSEEEKIILTGNPVVWEKGTRVSGRQITIYLNEERSVVEGDTHVRIEDEGTVAP